MPKVLIILIWLFSLYNANAKEYIFNGYGISKQYSINVSDDYKFSSYTSEGMWDDSNGDYGNEKCSGYVKQINRQIELEVICENINQDNEIFWNSRIRKSEKGGGTGKMQIINAKTQTTVVEPSISFFDSQVTFRSSILTSFKYVFKNFIIFFAGEEGLEPSTSGFGGRRSTN